VILITGSTSGLGLEVALALGETGTDIILHGRNRERGLEVVEEIRAGGRARAIFYAADFASLDQVHRFGEAVLCDYDRLDVLVNNAGISLSGDNRRRTSTDGYELSFAVNYPAQLAPFVPRTMKAMVHFGMEASLAGALMFEKYAQGALVLTEDKTEGISAMLEHRYPKYKGR